MSKDSMQISVTVNIPAEVHVLNGRLPKEPYVFEVTDEHIARLSAEERQLLATALTGGYTDFSRSTLKLSMTAPEAEWDIVKGAVLDWAHGIVQDIERNFTEWFTWIGGQTVESLYKGSDYELSEKFLRHAKEKVPMCKRNDPAVLHALARYEQLIQEAIPLHVKYEEERRLADEARYAKEDEANEQYEKERQKQEQELERLRGLLAQWAAQTPRLSRAVAEGYDVTQTALKEASALVQQALPPLVRYVKSGNEIHEYGWEEREGPSPAEFAQLDQVKEALEQLKDKLPEPDVFSVTVNRLRWVNPNKGSRFPAIWLDLCSPFWKVDHCIIVRCEV